eukprot:snap_masked-scaffold_15-processed-gene-7.16-mRNA-1 protein AED:1.00 eAED:1.00 QI:0/-1/0/0/-1/1/1/0/649
MNIDATGVLDFLDRCSAMSKKENIEFISSFNSFTTLSEALAFLQNQSYSNGFDPVKFDALLVKEITKELESINLVFLENSLLSYLNTFYITNLFPRLQNIKFFPQHFLAQRYPESETVQNTFKEVILQITTEKIFDIILQFPKSLAVCREISRILKFYEENFYLEYKAKLFYRIAVEVNEKLLNIGNPTIDIIHGYLSLIRVLRILDPAHNLVSELSVVVGEYLKRRKDTTHCIISLLTEDERIKDPSTKELQKEISKIISQETKEHDGDISSLQKFGTLDLDVAGRQVLENWVPEPCDKKGDFYRFTVEAADSVTEKLTPNRFDVLSLLIHIYVNQGQFMEEYKKVLANRLLFKSSRKLVAKEEASLAILRNRFGEAQVKSCEILLKDFTDSYFLRDEFDEGLMEDEDQMEMECFQAIVLSKNFWPGIDETQLNFTMPKCFQQMHHNFEKYFEQQRAPQKVKWLRNLGEVELDIEFDQGEKCTIACSPFQASMLQCIVETSNQCSSTEELALLLAAEIQDCVAGVNFWVSKGVIKKKSVAGKIVYQVLKRKGEGTLDLSSGPKGIKNEKSSSKPLVDSQFLQGYIVGILNNQRKLKVDEIHNKLKTFIQGERRYDKTRAGLKSILSILVEENVVEEDGEKYWLVRGKI